MNSIITEGNIISKIIKGENIDHIFDYAKSQLFIYGPIDTAVLEILSYLKLFQSEYFSKYESEIEEIMGLFYKNTEPSTLHGVIFDMYHQYIKNTFEEDYTPMQVNILKNIHENRYFSFSAPTSTGKSYVFRNIIKSSTRDVVVIVPSRALINEYYDKITKLVSIKQTNILTFVEHINTKNAERNIFILTPERAREIFKNKDWLNIELFLFDEAQLSDEHSVRGLYFDSIVRRVQNVFPNAKLVFSHPFISNPEAQLKRNNIENTGYYYNYNLKTVGQVFYAYDEKNNKYYHFGSNKKLLGNCKIVSETDPIEKALLSGGSVLIYVPKTRIYNKAIYSKFQRYIQLCKKIQDSDALELIEQLRTYIGASKENTYYYSDMLEKLQHGIVVHHGSLPLNARLILERFTQKGFCKICFATSTLEQGINMPFDVVFLDRLEASKSLSVKNLIGRAGRSTQDNKLDIGCVVVRSNAMSNLRKILSKEERISEVSRLDIDYEKIDEKYNEYKSAIKNNDFSDEYNLTNKDIKIIKREINASLINRILDLMIINNHLIKPNEEMTKIYNSFQELYQCYLGRELVKAEKGVLNTAIKILLWKVEGRTFSSICQYRYAYISQVNKRRYLIREGKKQQADALDAVFVYPYHDLPDNQLQPYSLIPRNVKAKDVDYDLIVYDTYDYLDKLIGFKLSDVFYAVFHQYYIDHNDNRALKLAKYIKYGTDNEKEIWMLRYGFSFEDIIWLDKCIDGISEEEIIFNNNVKALEKDQLERIEQYIN